MEAAILFCCHLVLRWYLHQKALLRVKCVDGSDWSRAVTWPMTSQLLTYYLKRGDFWALFCDDTIARGCYRSRSRSKNLRFWVSIWLVESSLVILLRTYCWWPLDGGCHLVLLPCSFVLIRLSHGVAGQGRRSKITNLLLLYNCQLGLWLVTLIL